MKATIQQEIELPDDSFTRQGLQHMVLAIYHMQAAHNQNVSRMKQAEAARLMEHRIREMAPDVASAIDDGYDLPDLARAIAKTIPTLQREG